MPALIADGGPQDKTGYGDDAAVLRDPRINLRAFGAGTDPTVTITNITGTNVLRHFRDPDWRREHPQRYYRAVLQ